MSWIIDRIMQKTDNRDDFEKIFQDYSDIVYRFCLYKTSDEEIAYDLTQETFFRFWRMMTLNKTIDKPKQYIYQIARNLIIDYYKKNKEVSLDTLQEDGFDPKDNTSSADLISEVRLLKDVIDSLDEEFREVIYMEFVEDMKVNEIAKILEISENLVSVRINRGKKILKEKFT